MNTFTSLLTLPQLCELALTILEARRNDKDTVTAAFEWMDTTHLDACVHDLAYAEQIATAIDVQTYPPHQ